MLDTLPRTTNPSDHRTLPERSVPLHARRRWVWAFVAVAAVSLAGGYFWWRARPALPHYVTAPVTKGDIVRAVISTGTLNPVVTVQVGSYVSGTIQKLYCDYNTHVKAGQLCAKIDPRPYQVVVDEAAGNLASGQAQLKKDQAGLAYAKINYERDMSLQKQGIVSQDTVDNDKSALDQAIAQIDVDAATIKQRRAALEAAQVNLGYTRIVSPVDGTVVSRNIDVGQTVAANFQTPTLFLIARDLTKMQVDTNVSESDVGGIQEGQKASFTVEAYPDRVFWGQVAQIRQAPITVQNVVTYDVVVNVDNQDFRLFPGMTANTRIISDERDQAMRVPVQALRFSLRERGQTETKPDAGQRVWVLRDKVPRRVPVTTGLSDGTYTEITGGDLKPDDQIIVNALTPADQKSGTQRSLLRF